MKSCLFCTLNPTRIIASNDHALVFMDVICSDHPLTA